MLSIWANGNYPVSANPWSGTPYQVDPNYTAFTPGQAPSAQEMNFIVAGLLAGCQAAQTDAVNFSANTLPSGFAHPRSAVFDPTRGLWLLGGISPPTAGPAIQYNYGGDHALWSAGAMTIPGSAGQSIVGLGVSPLGKNYFAACTDGAGTFVDFYSGDVGATWHNITSFLGTTTHAEYLTFNGNLVGAFGASGANAFIDVITNPDAATPGGWTSTTVTGVTAAEWLLKASPTVAVAIPRNSGATTYYTSANGTTWTTRTFDSSIVAGPDTPMTLTYNAALALFVLAVFVGTGGNPTRIATSQDGVTWTAIHTIGTSFTGPGLYLADLTSVNAILVGVTNDNATVAPQAAAGVSRVVYSPDGGNSWYFSPAVLGAGDSSVQRPRVHSSGASVLAFNAANTRLGNALGLNGSALT